MFRLSISLRSLGWTGIRTSGFDLNLHWSNLNKVLFSFVTL